MKNALNLYPILEFSFMTIALAVVLLIGSVIAFLFFMNMEGYHTPEAEPSRVPKNTKTPPAEEIQDTKSEAETENQSQEEWVESSEEEEEGENSAPQDPIKEAPIEDIESIQEEN